MSGITILLFVLGFVLLILGAECLVRGAANLASAFGVSPLVIGLTVVAFGTSAPELAVSVNAALNQQADIAVGNVVGSNICNVLLILGLSAAVAPLVVHRQLVWIDVPIVIAISGGVWIMGADHLMSRVEGLCLVGAGTLYLLLAIKLGKRDVKAADIAAGTPIEPKAKARRHIPLQLAGIVIGLGLLVLGANWLVDGAVELAKFLGLSELVIGLTIVAVGTSLPELATSVMASVKGQRDIAVGNVIGSNIFNILFILGISSAVAPDGVPVSKAALAFDIPVMTAVAVACLPIFLTGHKIYRGEGIIFLAYYAAYTAYLIMKSADHDALPLFSNIMLLFVMPLTAVTIVGAAWRSVRQARREQAAAKA
jgi:cation:H+ antiporter